MELIHITDQNFNITKKGTWYVTFWIPWGMPSFKQIEIIKKIKKNIKWGLVNVEENRDFADENFIDLYPTTLLYVNGKEKKRHVGLFSGDDI